MESELEAHILADGLNAKETEFVDEYCTTKNYYVDFERLKERQFDDCKASLQYTSIIQKDYQRFENIVLVVVEVFGSTNKP